MALTLPRFSMQSIASIRRAIRIENKGVILPIIFIEDKEDCAWEIPQHPIDTNMKISDTVWSTPAKLSLTGYVSIMKYQLVLQMIDSALKINQLFTVYYMGGVYNNMQFLSLSKTSNADNASSYKVQIEMQQIPFVMPQTTVITAAQAASVQNAETSLLGQAQAIEVKDNKTLALKFVNMIGGK